MTDKKRRITGKLIWLATASLAVVFDQLSKGAVVSYFAEVGAGKTVIPGVLDFTYVRNPGATAGMLANHQWVFMSLSSLVIVAVTLYLLLTKSQRFFGGLCLAAVVGGGIGNMIDRIAYGEVVDFIDVTLSDIFPFNTIFNIADVFVCIGCILLIISFIADEIKDKKAKKEASPRGE